MRRAGYRCEYCRVSQSDFLIGFHVDHIRSLKHGGSSSLENLALACSDCNAHKGTDLGTFLGNDHTSFTRFFNPRMDVWEDHFETEAGAIYSKTEVAEATIRIFQFNEIDRVIVRQAEADAGRFS